MFVRAPRVPSPGADVACHVFLDDESCVFSGKVAWARSGNTPIPEAGIEFVDLSQSERIALQRVLVKSDGPVVVVPNIESDTERIELAPRVVSRLSTPGRYGVAGGLLGLGLLWAFTRPSSTSAPSSGLTREPAQAIRPRVSPLSSSPLSRSREVPFEREVTPSHTMIRVAFKGSGLPTCHAGWRCRALARCAGSGFQSGAFRDRQRRDSPCLGGNARGRSVRSRSSGRG
jgi:hypothetical protein